MQLDGSGCCHAFTNLDVAYTCSERADVAARLLKQFTALCDEPGNRRLAVGPGHSNDMNRF